MTINETLGYQACALDIYGQVDAGQTEWFNDLQKRFPTYYEGEGFAGTLIDAYSAGVPVIASDWKYNVELVNENVGCVYQIGNQRAFIDILKDAAINPTMLLSKKRLCLKEAEKYKIDKAVRTLIEQMED